VNLNDTNKTRINIWKLSILVLTLSVNLMHFLSQGDADPNTL